jgi:hypothetical protein
MLTLKRHDANALFADCITVISHDDARRAPTHHPVSRVPWGLSGGLGP